MTTRSVLYTITVLALLLFVASSAFVVYPTQQAVVFQFREVKRAILDPGLHWKMPFIQDVEFFDRRVLNLDPPDQQVILSDQKRLEVDAFARYRIKDPVLFFQRLRDERTASDRLSTVINSSLRRVLGNVGMKDVLSQDRAKIMTDIRDQVNGEVKDLGIEIVDVRIRRADLPPETSQAIFARMRSEREREAAEFRAMGQEQSQEIKAKAERDKTVLLAEAQRDAQILRGKGDNEALRTMGEAAARDPQFYAFYRSLQAYRTSLGGTSTTMILSPDSEFFRYFSGASTPR